MELKNKLSFGAKRVEYLMEEYFDRNKVLGDCKACPNYAKYWSCPPYAFDEAIFLKQFKYMHIIGRQFMVPPEDIRNIRDPEAIATYCTEKLQAIKVMTWKTLLEIEKEVDGVMGLIPGNCPICEAQGLECARKTGEACRNSKLMRYSLESLGFNVVDLVKYEVGMTIEWSQNQRLPKVLTSVSAILCNEEIPKEILKKYFPDRKKSWERYDKDQLDTGFHTSETIKTSETIHGSAAQTKENARIIDDEMPAYRPQKSWVGYKAEKNPEDEVVKKGYTVTMQEEEAQSEPLPEETLETLEEEMHAEVSPEAAAEVFEEIPEAEEVVEEKDDTNYQWLGFKADLDDDELVKRPIPKMSELILEGEELPEAEAVTEISEPAEAAVAEAIPEPEIEAVAEIPEEIIEEVTEEAAEEVPEEEDDSKYQWLGYKTKLDDEDEPLVTKNTLGDLNIPK
ncbi:DUF2284 domain-containing protein [Acetobacterium bakii]|uniref:Metal-binding protein n=1 Tax=Acetobacterium bakii TaxID=52689 RepID=A0A0L6TWF3_9FIRM|nr:DUF2284 domain-containing protein [Acetobacterium bakii]KNZ40387.1 hypothetical protein AKG39_17920 [Acetobacterium bakii]